MSNFFDALGLSSDDIADAIPQEIVQVFHERGKEGVRNHIYEYVSARLQQPITIMSDVRDVQPERFGSDQPGAAIELIRDKKDLYRFAGGAPASASKKAPKPLTGSHKEQWDKRFQELKTFVETHGYRPRRQGDDVDDAERKLHFWMGQNQRKLNKNELAQEQAEKLSAVLQVKGGSKQAPKGSKKRSLTTSEAAATAAAAEASEGPGSVADDEEQQEEEPLDAAGDVEMETVGAQ